MERIRGQVSFLRNIKTMRGDVSHECAESYSDYSGRKRQMG